MTETRPVHFAEVNRVLTKPEGMTDEECGELPVFNDGKQSVSCWRLPWRERWRVLWSGLVWLGVVAGPTQPPVWVSGRRPFEQTGGAKGSDRSDLSDR